MYNAFRGEIMNIFVVDSDPVKAARSLCNSHVVKMILETAQMLSTSHRVLDGTPVDAKTKTGRRMTRYVMPDSREDSLYQATHINHPCAVWARGSLNNHNWLVAHFISLCDEYTHRYGKVHKCDTVAHTSGMLKPPIRISHGYLLPHPMAMPDECQIGSVVESYREYYRYKRDSGMKMIWTNSPMPDWMI